MNNPYLNAETCRKRQRERNDDNDDDNDANADGRYTQRRKYSRHDNDRFLNGIGARDANSSQRRLRHEDYTVGWICALPKELAAATAMLDHRHERLLRLPGDHNFYSFGSIGPHNVVITCLPSGNYGTVNAAVVASNMARSFPSVAYRLMVGIGGGVPNTDIRLGDVVVGHSVLQYDLGKTTQGGEFRCTSSPVKPPPVMLTAVSQLRGCHESGSTLIPTILTEMHDRDPGMKNYKYPGHCPDRLFDSTYEHDPHIESCDKCDQSRLTQRPARLSTVPRIHYGTIASGNKVVKHAKSRDIWAKNDDILCFEMEAAGLIDNFPCLVIRGICDYCDSHKSKEWQEYAATTAAAYAKELLLATEATSDGWLQEVDTLTTTESSLELSLYEQESEAELKRRFYSLQFIQMNDRCQNIRKAHLKTCKWLLSNEKYCDWIDPHKTRQHGGFLWIKGKPGSGKSTMMKFIVETTQKENYENGNDQTTISFFFNARGHHLEKSTTGLYRSMLFQVIQHNPGLKTILTSPAHFRGKSHWKWTNELLKELIEGAIERLTSSIVCVIDALDECDDDEIRDMISFFERLGEVAVARRVGLLVCFSSRHYPHITMREGVGLELQLEEEKEHDADIAEYINSELRIGDSKHAQGIRNMVQERASGVFMWVVLVVNILNKERGRMHALRSMLRKIPQDLNALFFNILSRSSGNEDEVLLCFQLVLFARRPLSPLELHFAILSQVTNGNLEPGDLNEKEAQIFIVESSRGLAEITGTLNPTVQFIHQSVEDFLLQGDMLVKLWPKLGANLIGNSHLRLRDICLQYLSSDKTKLNTSKVNRNLERLRLLFPFMAYAVQNALYHADQAAKFGIQQQDFISIFPKSKWIKLYNFIFLSEKEYYPPDTRIIYILAEIDAPNLLEALPSTLSCIEIGSERYGCPLLAAIIKESRNCFWVFRENLIKSVPVPSESFLQKNAWVTEILDLNTRPKLNLDWLDKLYPLATNHLRKLKGGLEFSSSKASLISYLLDHGDVELLNAVVQKDCGAGQRSTLDDALSVASTRANETVLKFLLQHDKGDVNFKCRVGRTPLSWAIRNGHTDVIKLLLSKIQTDPNLKDNNGWTPLSWAAGMGYVEVIKLLLATGRIEADTRDDLGRTAFSLAAGRGYTEVIKLLLSSGQTDPNSKDNCGRTPLYWAAGMGHAGVIKLLLASGLADFNSRDNNGQTPLSLATERGHIEVIKILLLSGQTDPN